MMKKALKPLIVAFALISFLTGVEQAGSGTCQDELSIVRAEAAFAYFSAERVQEINRVADQIERLTTREDTILFVGRSPVWFAETLKIRGSDRQVLEAAFSGRPTRITQSEDDAYIRYLDRLLDPQALRNGKGNLILVDHMQTGESLRAFWELVRRWQNKYKLDPYAQHLKVINLTHSTLPLTFRNFSSDHNILISRDLIVFHANQLNEFAPIPYFPITKWETDDPIAYQPPPETEKIRALLRAAVTSTGAISKGR